MTMKKKCSFSLLCLGAAVLLTFSGCGDRLTPPVLSPDITSEDIYLEAAGLAEDGWNFSAYLKYNSIRGYEDSAQKADHHLRQYARWAIDRGYFDEMYFVTRYMNLDDETNREFLRTCADEMIAGGSEDSLLYAEYILDEIGESHRIDEMEEQKLQAEYEADLQEGIACYRAGNYNMAYAVLPDRYSNDDPVLELYHNLCHYSSTFSNPNSWTPSSIMWRTGDGPEAFMDQLLVYADTPDFAGREDAADFLSHTVMDMVRFFDSNWKCGDYYIRPDFDPDLEFGEPFVEHNLPKDYFPEISKMYIDHPNGCIIFCNSNGFEVFRLLGFISDAKHPDEMYILDFCGNELTFTRSDCSAVSPANVNQ